MSLDRDLALLEQLREMASARAPGENPEHDLMNAQRQERVRKRIGEAIASDPGLVDAVRAMPWRAQDSLRKRFESLGITPPVTVIDVIEAIREQEEQH